MEEIYSRLLIGSITGKEETLLTEVFRSEGSKVLNPILLESDTIQNEYGIIFEKKIVYNQETEVIFKEKYDLNLILKLSDICVGLKKELDKILPLFQDTQLSLINIFSQEKIPSLFSLYVRIQKNFEKSINNFYSFIESEFNSSKNLITMEEFFKEKFNKQKKYNKSKKYFIEWFEIEHSYKALFPKGVYFPNLKTIQKETVDFENLTRVEEERRVEVISIDPLKQLKEAFITMPRDFRKSLQANICDQLYNYKELGEKYYTIDIDAVGLHANFVLRIFKLSSNDVNWTHIFQALEIYLLRHEKESGYKPGILDKLKIDRGTIKSHLLAILNGRSSKTPFRVLEEFQELYKTDYLKKSEKTTKEGDPIFVSIYEPLLFYIKKFFEEECEFFKFAIQVHEK